MPLSPLSAVFAHRRPSVPRPLRALLAVALLCGTLLAVLSPAPARAEETYRVGLRTLGFWLPDDGVRLDVNVWYPTNWTPRELRFPPWRVEAARNSDAVAGRFPLIVLSHPSAGTRFSYHDTAAWLAEHGFVVAAPTHARDCMRNMDQLHTWQQFAGRLKDTGALIDQLLRHEKLGKSIDPQRIGFLGFGAGGTTGLLLGGALPDCERLDVYCAAASPQDPYCNSWARRQLVKLCNKLPLTVSPADTRIKVVAAVNPTHLMLFDTGLRWFHPRLLLVSAAQDGDSDSRLTEELARRLAQRARFLRLPDADGGALLAPCPPSLAEELPELCLSVTPQERFRQQELLRQELLAFFLQWLGSSENIPVIPAPPDLTPKPEPAPAVQPEKPAAKERRKRR